MAIILLQPDGVPITAKAARQGSAALYGGGSGRPLGGRSGFRVDTPDDVLTVTTTSWTLRPCSAYIDPGAQTDQGMYGWASTANESGTPTPPDSTLPRKDIYFIQVNDSTSGDGSGAVEASVEYLAGTPSTSPVAPDLPARSFLIATVTVPQVGGGNPSVVPNKARFVAAGAPLPVWSLAERDGLSKYDGLSVQRMDAKGRPTETWDANLNDWYGSVKPSADRIGWALTGSLHRRAGAAGTQVGAAFKAIYGGGTFPLNSSWTLAFTLTNTGYLPVGNDAYGYFMLRASVTPPVGTTPRALKADCAFTIDPTGAVYVRTLLGQSATTVAVGDELSFNTVWNA